MKRIHLGVLMLAAFGFSSQAFAQCSNASLNGTLFTSFGGSVKTNSTTLAHEDLGKVVADGNGVFTGQITASVAGVVSTLPVTGTYTIHPNCSGTGTVTAGANTVQFAMQLVNGGGLTLASVTSSPVGQIGEGHLYRTANATGGTCGNGTLSGTYGSLLSGGTYAAAVRTAYDAANQITFDGNGGVSVAGEVTSGTTIGAAWNGTGTYSLAADCSGTLQVISTLGTVNYNIARIEGGNLLLLETDANTTVSGTAQGLQNPAVVPQIAFGGGWYSALYFTNTSSVTATFVVTFTADAGTPLNIPGIGTSKHITLAPQETTIIEATNSGSLTQGYATFAPPVGVTGYAIFRQSVAGRFDQEALANFKSANATATSFTWDETGTLSTALALANPSTVPVTATITAWDNTGTLIGTGTLDLAAGTKTAATMRSISGLSGVVGLRGSALVTVPVGNISVLALRFSGSAFTSIPTTQQ